MSRKTYTVASVLAMAWTLFGAVPRVHAAAGDIRLVVVDPTGAPIPGARIVVSGDGAQPAPLSTDESGQVSVPVQEGTVVEATISAQGYSSLVVRLGPSSGSLVKVALVPPAFSATVEVVAGTDASMLRLPASTTTISSEAIRTSAAGTIDDLLRSTPGFSLFRRSSSRTANPTTQGVTLRGVSGSGASRTLVTADGVPLNDPFGSWVYWNRVPEAAIERIDVVRGPASDVWGTDALGGLIRIVTVAPTRSVAQGTVEAGTRSTGRGSAFAGATRNGWAISGAVEAGRSDGAFVLAASDRGAVDVPAFSNYSTGTVGVGWHRSVWRSQLSGSWFKEDRGNGTPLQSNGTTWRQLAGNVSGAALGGVWDVRYSGGRQSYAQTFTAVSGDRTTERLTSQQDVPTTFARAGSQWVRQVRRLDVAFGGDWRHTRSMVNETQYPAASAPPTNTTGGDERVIAGFARAQFVVGDHWTIGAGARVDAWTTTPAVTAPDQLPGSTVAVSPRATVSFTRGPVSAHVSAGRASRIPTLNELYRGFRAGNVVTAANDHLVPERLTAIEGGAVFRGRGWSARATAYANVLDDAISNLTVRSTPSSILRVRSNSDSLRAAGGEIEAEWRPVPGLRLSAQVAMTDSRFRSSRANPSLAGNRVPQVPVVSGGGAIGWDGRRFGSISLQTRASSMAFDDDLNTLTLAPFGVVDLYAGRSFGRATAFVAIENLLDVEYDVARTPQRSVGWPRSVRCGMRITSRGARR